METYNVVIVEDEPYAARHIKALIEKEDYFRVVAVFDNGEDALSSFASGRLQVDLLVTDIQMPGISGLDLIQEIQRLHPGIPSIIISGFGSFSYAKEAISLGTMKYILKPIDVEELGEALKEAYCEIKKRRMNPENILFGESRKAVKTCLAQRGVFLKFQIAESWYLHYHS